MQEQRNDFSQGSIPKTIVRLALPMIGAQIINVLYNIVDRIYIGRIPDVGRLALTGVGLTFPIITLITGFAVLAGNGGAPLASIARGTGDERQAERIMGNSFFLLLIFGVCLTGLGLLFKAPILRAFGASDATMPYADQYISIYLLGSLAVMITMGMNPFINGQGFPKVGMLTVAIGAVMNLILDPLFIFGLGMGVQGAAIATVISQVASAIWVLRFLTGKKAILRLRRKNLRPSAPIIRQICSLGFSNFTMSMTESAVQIVCNRSLGIYGGDIYIGVMTVVNSVRQVIMMPMNGFSQGASPVIGFNYGAKRYDRVKRAIKVLTATCVTYAIVVWAVAMLVPELLIRIFNNDPALLEVGVPSLRTYFCMFFFMSLQMAGQNSFVALGQAKHAIFFSLLRKAVIVIPLTLILPGIGGLGVRGVFLAEPISDVIGSVACFTTFMLTMWRRLTALERTQAEADSASKVSLKEEESP